MKTLYNLIKKSLILITLLFLVLVFASCSKEYYIEGQEPGGNGNGANNGTVTDIDGNVYHTVTIGTQVWMVENLKVTHYRNGDAIPNVTNSTTWVSQTTGSYCDYNNQPTNSITYGRLYNWYTVADARNLCPIGWHVPIYTEWQTIINYLGQNTAGGQLKESGTSHWLNPNTGATNNTGFTALPAGFRNMNGGGGYDLIGTFGNWWSSTETISSRAWYRILYYNGSNVTSHDYDKFVGFSVRCLKN